MTMERSGIGSMLDRFVLRAFGPVWTCTHDTGATVEFRAHSKAKARRKLAAFLRDQIYGPWALTYSPAVVSKHLRRCTITQNVSNDVSEGSEE